MAISAEYAEHVVGVIPMAKPRAKIVMPVREEIGPVRYSQERLFWGVEPATVKALKQVWADDEQLATEAVPEDSLCVVILLAAWGRRFGVELVDDYDLLLQRARDAMAASNLHHPDLYFVSCVCILAQREDAPTVGAFEQINIPEHYENLIG